jgi:hypothetical protein
MQKEGVIVIPVQAWTRPEASRNVRLPDFMTVGMWRW